MNFHCKDCDDKNEINFYKSRNNLCIKCFRQRYNNLEMSRRKIIKAANKFKCDVCNFNTYSNNLLAKHYTTKKHKNRIRL